MEKTQKIVLALLVLAIIFSATSAFISFHVLNSEVPQKTSGNVVGGGRGTLDFFVESSSSVEEGSNG